MELHQLFGDDIALKGALLVAGVSSLLSDRCAIREISLTSNLGQQAQRRPFTGRY